MQHTDDPVDRVNVKNVLPDDLLPSDSSKTPINIYILTGGDHHDDAAASATDAAAAAASVTAKDVKVSLIFIRKYCCFNVLLAFNSSVLFVIARGYLILARQ